MICDHLHRIVWRKSMTIRHDQLSKTNFADVLARPRKRLAITHPGQFLLTEFLEPHELKANALANALHVPANRITAILKGQRGITADTALRLARYFGTTPDLWLNMQKDYELRLAKDEAKAEIDSLVRPMAA
jgi:addiction module HigA family antidote